MLRGQFTKPTKPKLNSSLPKNAVGVEKSERALEAPSAAEVFDFYSSTIVTHVVGLAAAYEHDLFMTVACRLISTYLYQKDYSGKGNNTVPTDPKKLQKYIKDGVESGAIPRHRLPKGYTFPKDVDDDADDDHVTGKKGRKGRKGKKSKSKGKKKGKADDYGMSDLDDAYDLKKRFGSDFSPKHGKPLSKKSSISKSKSKSKSKKEKEKSSSKSKSSAAKKAQSAKKAKKRN